MLIQVRIDKPFRIKVIRHCVAFSRVDRRASVQGTAVENYQAPRLTWKCMQTPWSGCRKNAINTFLRPSHFTVVLTAIHVIFNCRQKPM